MDRLERTCIGCRRRDHKSQLVRLVWKSVSVVVDPRQVEPGRGAYLHRAQGCVQAAVRRRAVGRALRLDAGRGGVGLEEAMEPWITAATTATPGSTA